MNRYMLLVAMMIVFLLAIGPVSSIAKERNEVKDMDKWDLTALYPSVDAFKEAKAQFEKDLTKLAQYKGKLTKSSEELQAGLDLYYDLEKRIRRMEAYTWRLLHQDTRISANKALQAEVETLRTRLGKEASFIDPELVATDEKKLMKYLKKDAGLKIYDFPIRETIRRKAHILSDEQEKILAATNDFANTGESVYSLFLSADMPRETLTLQDGSELKMVYPNFDKVRRGQNEKDRVAVFDTFFGQFQKYQRTIAQLLYSQMKMHNVYASLRGYDSTLQAALDYDNIDTDIYMSLIEAAHQNFPAFHRYLKLKARALGKEKLDYTDLYVPFTRNVKIDVPYEKAQTMLTEALEPLGDEYVNTVKEAFANNWVDVYPTEGKETGAYSSGWAYDVHPFILMNYHDSYSEALTLAHEFGHAMHSYYSNKNQPFPTADYSTFVAEVASTFNENLLNDYMLKKVQNEDERLYLLGNFLDGSFKGTFFRQIQFAEFELLIHQEVEKGEALTDEKLNKMYLELTRKYYGHDEGACNVPQIIEVEWAHVPHFYYNYYLFQYATSIAAASLISQNVLNEEPGALDKYFNNMLKAGGSSHTVEILKNAGADMTKPEAYKAFIARANRYMDELEILLDKREGKK